MKFYHALLQMFYGYWLWSGFIELYCLSYWIALELDSFLYVDQIRGQNRFVVELGQCVPWIQFVEQSCVLRSGLVRDWSAA